MIINNLFYNYYMDNHPIYPSTNIDSIIKVKESL